MKKFTFIIALLGITMMSFAAKQTSLDVTKQAVSTFHEDLTTAAKVIHQDAKVVTSTLYGDGKDVITSLYPDVKSAVMAIGQAIGVAAEHVYTVLVKKFVVDGIVQLLPFLLGLTLILIGWIKMSTYFKQYTKLEWHILYPSVLVIAGIIALCCVNYNVMIMGLVNPEYGALNYILEYSKEMLK